MQVRTASNPKKPEPDPAGNRSDGNALHTTCMERTANALFDSGAATQKEIHSAAYRCYEALDLLQHAELIEQVARVQGAGEENISEAVAALSYRLAETMEDPPALVPFAAKLIVPNTFYASHPEILRACHSLLCPVVYAEDTDAVGVASINPVATVIAAEKIREIVFAATGIRPFVTTALVTCKGWRFLIRKHFER